MAKAPFKSELISPIISIIFLKIDSDENVIYKSQEKLHSEKKPFM